MAKKAIPLISMINPDLTTVSKEDLLSLRVHIDKEFKKRGIRFSTGEVGETVAIDFFTKKPGLSNLQKAPTGTKNVDALSRNGERYSIKTIKDGAKTGTIYPDPINKDQRLFEYILLVLLNDDYELDGLYRFSWERFLEIRKWDKTMNAWYIPKTKKVILKGDVIYEKGSK